MDNFATRLSRAIFYKDIKPIDVSKRSGINKSQISRYISGETRPSVANAAKIAAALGVSTDWLLGKEPIDNIRPAIPSEPRTIPVLGKVAGGDPMFIDEDVIGEIYMDDENDLFALKMKGDSMSPRILDGDTVVVRSQKTAEDGDLVIAIVDGEATCKVLKRSAWGITLIPFNTAFQPIVFAGQETDRLEILGVVVESRHTWKN